MAEATWKKLEDGTWGAWVKGRKVKPGSLIGIKSRTTGNIEERRVAKVLAETGEGKERVMLVTLEEKSGGR